jgi:flagellar hook protein FlgE
MRMAPKATSSISLIENLGSAENLSAGANAFFSLAGAWNGKSSPPLNKDVYSHASSLTIYDSLGNPQSVTAYFDYAGTFDGKKVYEYVLAADPAADKSARAGTEGAGLLAAGTMTFSSTGEIMDMTLFDAPAGNHRDFSAWTPSGFGADGKPAIKADFGSGEQTVSLDFGLETGGSWTHGYANAAAVAADPAALYTGPGKPAAANHSTNYAGSSANISSHQNGYAEGSLLNLQVTRDGYVNASYSNNQNQDLFRVPLYRFTSQDNLRHEGGNRYSAGPGTGRTEHGFPGEENYGSVYGQHLEQSNVDMATEFANMIITQRGFQMNSKVVTTSDAMLQRALELKRQ